MKKPTLKYVGLDVRQATTVAAVRDGDPGHGVRRAVYATVFARPVLPRHSS